MRLNLRTAQTELPVKKPKAGTFSALIEAYRDSPEWKQLSRASQRDYTRYLDEVAAVWGNLVVAGLEARHVLELRNKKADTPATANYLVRVLSSVISWSVPRGYRTDNPCKHVPKLKGAIPYDHWSMEQILHFRENVSKPELWWALALALYSDDLGMLWSDYANGMMHVIQEKTGKKLWISMHRDLSAVVAGIPRRATTILTNTRGCSWTSDGFRSSWATELKRPVMAPLREAGLVFHGLRKSAVVFLLEAGCTVPEVSAITGQSHQMVEHYALQVNQKKLAAAAIFNGNCHRTGICKTRSLHLCFDAIQGCGICKIWGAGCKTVPASMLSIEQRSRGCSPAAPPIRFLVLGPRYHC